MEILKIHPDEKHVYSDAIEVKDNNKHLFHVMLLNTLCIGIQLGTIISQCNL